MVRRMEDKLLIQYILFAFSPDPMAAATGPPMAALTLHSSDGQTPHLKVYTRPGWDKNYEPGEDLQLARETLNAWETLNPSEVVALFGELRDASMGPLRAGRSGTCTETELKELLAKELQFETSAQHAVKGQASGDRPS
jgi:hypothetical protein